MRFKKSFFIVLILILCSTLSLAACGDVDVKGVLKDVATQLSAPTGLRVDSGMLCWNPVEFASHYTVNIDGHEFLCDDYRYSLDGIKDGEHVFKVKANGDGVLYVTSPFSEELVRTLEGGAVASSGYYGQFDELTKNESFLGYGFDVIRSAVFSDKYIRLSAPIFDTEALMNQRLLKVDSKHSIVNEVQNSDLSKFMQQWNASLNVNVGWDGWLCAGSVDVAANYSGGVDNAESMYYHVITIENQKFYIVLQSDIETLKSILSDGFITALYSDIEPAVLFERFGTHFITSAVMGGKINSYYHYSSNESKSFHEMSAKVSADVRTFITETNVSASGGYRQQAEKQNIYIKNSLEVIGGGDFGMISDSDIAKNYHAWEKSLDDHASLMGIKDSGSLIPIWELFDSSLSDGKIYKWNYTYVDEKGIEHPVVGEGNRAEQLQAYFYAYGQKSYNDLMKSAGLHGYQGPTDIKNITINGKESLNNEYEVYAGADNVISFSVEPHDALGYTKEATISTDTPYASIDNKGGNLLLRIDSSCPHNTILRLTLSAGIVRKQITVRVVKRYTVTFDTGTDDVVVPSYQNVPHGQQIKEPEVPKRDGYVLVGWFTDFDCTEDARFIFGEQRIMDDTVLYAKWAKSTYTVSFDSKGGSFVDSIIVEYNKKINPPTPVRKGFVFTGWFKNPDLNLVFDYLNEGITMDITLYAGWSTAAITIHFDTCGGNSIVDYILNEGDSLASDMPTPVKPGYIFKGWFMDSTYINRVYPTTTFFADTTLYAQWEMSPLKIRVIGIDENSCSNGEYEERTLMVLYYCWGDEEHSEGYYLENNFENKITSLFNYIGYENFEIKGCYYSYITNNGHSTYSENNTNPASYDENTACFDKYGMPTSWKPTEDTTIYAYCCPNQYTLVFMETSGPGIGETKQNGEFKLTAYYNELMPFSIVMPSNTYYKSVYRYGGVIYYDFYGRSTNVFAVFKEREIQFEVYWGLDERIENKEYQTNKDVYYVKNETDLNDVRKYPSETFWLVANVELHGNWQPIPSFSGVFEGLNHTISGLRIEQIEFVSNNEAKYGLVEHLYGKIQNLNIVGSSIFIQGHDGNGIVRAGLVAGVSDEHSVIQAVTISNSSVQVHRVNSQSGAIVGTSAGKILNCTCQAIEIYGNGDAGGVVGGLGASGLVDYCTVSGSNIKHFATISAKSVGGIVGYCDGATIAHSSINNSTIILQGFVGLKTCLGYIVGHQNGGSVVLVGMENCTHLYEDEREKRNTENHFKLGWGWAGKTSNKPFVQ